MHICIEVQASQTALLLRKSRHSTRNSAHRIGTLFEGFSKIFEMAHKLWSQNERSIE